MGLVMDYLQYDVYVFDPEPVRGKEVKKIRPCVILSPDELNAYLATIIIAPLTTKDRDYPFRPHVTIDRVHGSIMLDQIRCVDKSRLSKRIASLPHSAVLLVKDVLQNMLVD
jgi:mRNA interferase MazF